MRSRSAAGAAGSAREASRSASSAGGTSRFPRTPSTGPLPRTGGCAARRDDLAGLADHRDRLPDGHLAGLDRNLEQDTGNVGLHLLGHLVGVELVKRLAALHAVSDRLQPLDDRPGLHALPEARKLDVASHARPFS